MELQDTNLYRLYYLFYLTKYYFWFILFLYSSQKVNYKVDDVTKLFNKKYSKYLNSECQALIIAH